MKRLASLQPSYTFFLFLEFHGQFARPQLIKNNTITVTYGLQKNMLATRKNSVRFSEITIICIKTFFFYFFFLYFVFFYHEFQGQFVRPQLIKILTYFACYGLQKKHVTDANEFYTFSWNYDYMSWNTVPGPFLQFWSLISWTICSSATIK